MKTGKLAKIALLGGALVLPASADKVQFEQLPQHMQDKIRAQTGSARIEDIDREVRDGRTFYQVGFKNSSGQHTELRFEDSANNQVAASSTAALDSRKVQYSELPVPVRRTADRYTRAGEVNDVERKVRNGQVTYEIGYKGANGTGPQRELVLSENGNVVRASDPQVASANPNATTSSTTSPSISASSAGGNRTLNYADLPQSVRSTAESHLRNGHVERVERSFRNGELDYTLWFRKDDGQYQQMVISERGQIVSNQLLQDSSVGSAGVSQSGSSTSQTGQSYPYANITSPVQLRNSIEVDRSQVPAEIRRVIREQSRNGNVEEILRGDWAGKQVYQVAFTDQNNKYVELQLDSNGQVIYDPRSAGQAPATTILNNIGRLFDGK